MSGVKFEDNFRVESLNQEGKFFQNVDRLHCISEHFKIDLILDINCMLFTVEVEDKFRLVLNSTLSDYGYPDSYEYDQKAQPAVDACAFDYIMYGKVYRVDENLGRVAVYISFGGLLCRMQGELTELADFNVDDTFFIMLKKHKFDV